MVVLLRGLNTYQGDDVQIGVVRLGNFYRHWTHHLQKRGVSSLSVSGLGPGTIKSSYETAVSFLQEKIKSGSLQKFHLLTHSSGGLIGRKLTLDARLHGRILSLTTVACPHSGSELVTLAEQWSRKASARSVLAAFGYDLDERLDHIRELSVSKMDEFNKFHPPMKSVQQINIPCSLPNAQRSWLFTLLGRFLKEHHSSEGDGLLPLRSQLWPEAEEFGPLQLDHLSSLGFFTHLSAKNRALAQRELERMFDHLVPIWAQQG